MQHACHIISTLFLRTFYLSYKLYLMNCSIRLCSESMAATKQKITSARHTLEIAAKTLTMAVALCRNSWLRATFLQPHTKLATEDLPLDCQGLFCASTDATFQEINKNIKTFHTLGVSSMHRQYHARQPYSKQWPCRSNSSKSPDKAWKHCPTQSTRQHFGQHFKYQSIQQQPKVKQPRQPKQNL